MKKDKVHKKYEALEDNIRHTFSSIVWSHKIHEKRCDILTTRINFMETLKMICAALTSTGAVSTLLINTDKFRIIISLTSLFSFLVLVIDTYILTFDAKNEIKRHKVSALQLLDLRNKFINLLMETKIRKSKYNELYLKYKLYLEELNYIYQTSPISTSKYAEIKAEEALRECKTYSQSDIDSFLPPFLKKYKN